MILLITGMGGGAADAGQAAAPAATGSASARLAKLSNDYWQGRLQASPVAATAIGDRRYDDRLDDNSPAGRESDRRRLTAVLAEASAIPASELGPADRLTLSALVTEVQGELAREECALEDWNVDPLFGPHV